MLPFAIETARLRIAQQSWAMRPLRERLQIVCEFRHRLVEQIDALTAAVRADVGRPADEVAATDLLPTAAACKYLEAQAARILAAQHVRGRPLWLQGCRDVIHRRPWGIVGVIGTWNYPVFLTAVPILHALVAGNAVLFKPSEQTPRTAAVLRDLWLASGVPADVLITLPATREGGGQLAEGDVDFVHFTGSETVGRKLAARLGERLIPSTLELSGCDAAFVLADADVELAARAAWYGATLNGGQTCMAVRRAYVARAVYPRFLDVLKPLVEAAPAMRLQTAAQVEQMRRLVGDAKALRPAHARNDERDVLPTAVLWESADGPAGREACFAPLLAIAPFDNLDDTLRWNAAAALQLTASFFSADTSAATQLAAKLPAGSVVINDVIAPTAHPATPFGGRGASGWGVTQGAEGLLQMTVPQVVTIRNGRFRPHVAASLNRDPAGGEVVRGLLRLTHGRRWRERLRGLWQMLAGMRHSK